jgi:hypothetical protein
MLWDSPAIGPAKMPPLIDCLIVCANPLSGQCWGFARSEFYELVVVPLRARYSTVVVANGEDGLPTGYSLSEIGALSTVAKRIICLPNGPAFPTFNKWNKDVPRIIFLSPAFIDYGQPKELNHHVKDAAECRAKCVELGWL